MLKKTTVLALLISFLCPLAIAQETQDQDYINKLNYRRNKLEIIVKHRNVNVQSSYSSTDINTSTYTYESWSQTMGNISTSSQSQAEVKEITDWYIYKGGLRELLDTEFLALVDDRSELARVRDIDNNKSMMRLIGNSSIAVGIATMIGGAAMSAGQAVITGGALVTVSGFFISAFNLSPHHYIQPDYAQGKIDEYNIALKRNLNLPLTYE
jgi:hypothetical protein